MIIQRIKFVFWRNFFSTRLKFLSVCLKKRRLKFSFEKNPGTTVPRTRKNIHPWKKFNTWVFFKEQSETGSVWLHTLIMGDVSFRKVKELLFDFSYVSGIFFKTAWNFFFILVWKKSQLFFVLKNVPSQLTRFSGRLYTPGLLYTETTWKNPAMGYLGVLRKLAIKTGLQEWN